MTSCDAPVQGPRGGLVYTLLSPHHPQGIISAGSADGLTLDFSDIGAADISLGGYPEPTTS
ncbi:hypothetical protein QMK19_33425 [Streptomyces sp. H10-C2]|uniref:hypothetical protein n=1 Tax=unclassified Streptomyces TaxID=2593676 RepID=UPI0024BA6121|nr:MULTISPECIES: hypothetical protein [unclassified Streptomyces]MDJ0346460.1 hypothetical protein [Streptomyces sp. PH10-H1]MDJ0374399.1 hypothetical protein [Streptomyces sp. H10-C2]